MGFHLNQGERGLLIGQTGSGKSQDGIYQLRSTTQRPVIIFDTKIEDEFFKLPHENEKLVVVESLQAFEKIEREGAKQEDPPDFILVRPSSQEMLDKGIINDYINLVYEGFGPAFVYFDEIYSWHDGGKATPAMLALLTRGRSRGKTTLMASQRPAWISRFCLTESQKFYVHFLGDKRDKKTVSDIIPNFDQLPQLEKYHLYFFEVGDESPRLYKPVPMIQTKKENEESQLENNGKPGQESEIPWI